MDIIERINRRVETLHGIKHAIEVLPYAHQTIDKHCELRRIYLDRLRSLRLMFVDAIEEFSHQEERVERHIQYLTSPDAPLDTSVAPTLPAPHNTTTESGRV